MAFTSYDDEQGALDGSGTLREGGRQPGRDVW
jgi:hypothetical protein